MAGGLKQTVHPKDFSGAIYISQAFGTWKFPPVKCQFGPTVTKGV